MILINWEDPLITPAVDLSLPTASSQPRACGMIVGYLASLLTCARAIDASKQAAAKGEEKPLDGLTFFTQKNG